LTETRHISDIKVGPRFRKDLGDLDMLAKSIQETGLLHPVVINQNNELIAGARRLEACKFLLGWTEIPVTIINLDDIVKGELHENTVRMDFKFSERIAILQEIERQRSNLERDNKGRRSAEIVSDYVDVSPAQLYKEKKVFQAINNDPKLEYLVREIDDESITVHHATKLIQESRERSFMPDGIFDMIFYKNYSVASVNKDSSLCCWLCMIDWTEDPDPGKGFPHYLPMYSHDDWATHFLSYHVTKGSKFNWDKYSTLRERPEWLRRIERKKERELQKKRRQEKELHKEGLARND
jgi:ParB/RepB/Spo0J family partition protein